ncbi:MAG: hypothetical protein HYY11_03100 [Candidatus Methylomirabilis oxyfera]|nr:hypothetical protein [Candidatus Methylomirabilis oxyfera]
MWWLVVLATVIPIADRPGDLTPPSAYLQITNIDALYSMSGRDPDMRRGAEQMMDELINRLQRVPGINDPYADHPLRPCLRAAVLTRQSRRLEWERIISRIPDDGLRWAGRAAGDAARKALAECRPL